MARMTPAEGIAKVRNWAAAQRALKLQSPRHRVIIDNCMEGVHTFTPRELVAFYKPELLESPRTMAGIPVAEVWENAESLRSRPVGGAGGLGIVSETIGWTGARYGEQDGFGLALFSLLHSQKKHQSFEGNSQNIGYENTVPREINEDYVNLGQLVEIDFLGGKRPLDVWLFTGYSTNERDFVPAFRLSLPGVTGVMYHRCDSVENFDQMHVLGQGGFRVAQYFGLIGVDEPITDLVIGHDGHTALFKLNLLNWFYDRTKDFNAALAATRKLCAATIHAPQAGTVSRTTGEMVKRHYQNGHEKNWGLVGLDPFKPTNALFAEIRMSDQVGVVSPLHLMVTQAEEKAVRRGFAGDAARLLPDDFNGSLTLNTDAIDVPGWLGMGTAWTLDRHFPGWRENPQGLAKADQLDRAILSLDFRRDLADAFIAQTKHLQDLLNGSFERRFDQELPENAIVFASLRRAAAYKIDLTTEFLGHYELYDKIAAEIGRPIFYLFGGAAHQDDFWSKNSLERLLAMIEKINSQTKLFKADFLIDYDYDRAKWIFPGLAARGCWVGCTNPFDRRSQGTEAFGPSYIKSAVNGLYVMGADDGGASCLRHLPTVRIYGPTTHANGISFHNDLWGNQQIVQASKFLLANGFVRVFEELARRIDSDLKRFEAGRGEAAPGLDAKIEAIFQAISAYNGRGLLDSYLRKTR